MLELLRVPLPYSVEAPGLARDAVGLLADRLGDGADDVRLLVSELVTNAVRHGRSDAHPQPGAPRVRDRPVVHRAVRPGGGGA